MTLEVTPTGFALSDAAGVEKFSTDAPMFHQIGVPIIGSVTTNQRVATNSGDLDVDEAYGLGSCDARATLLLGTFKIAQADPWPSLGAEDGSWFQAGGTYVHEFRPLTSFKIDGERLQVNGFYPVSSRSADQRHIGYWRSFDWIVNAGQVQLRERCFIKQKNDERPESAFISRPITFDYYLIVGTIT